MALDDHAFLPKTFSEFCLADGSCIVVTIAQNIDAVLRPIGATLAGLLDDSQTLERYNRTMNRMVIRSAEQPTTLEFEASNMHPIVQGLNEMRCSGRPRRD